ncbi:MAG: glycosyltransferase family 4 protein [Rhizobiales bacterium]|nr:glycosyltransferase family 4 protein [Hyphomicrobiales bacterium]
MANLPGQPKVLHVSSDFPDPVEPFKANVVKNVLQISSGSFDHSVFSLNRKSPPLSAVAYDLVGRHGLQTDIVPFEHGDAITYLAPPLGILHRTKLEQLGDVLAERALRGSVRPNLVMGHKLTIEGIVANRIAKRLGVPFGLSIQGNTDLKIIASRPDLRRYYARILKDAAIVFPFTPWAQAAVERSLGPRDRATLLLPCPSDLDQARAPQGKGDTFVSVFHLKNYPGKNLAGIAKAYRLLARDGTPPPLDVIGGGTDEDFRACGELTQAFPQIRLVGAMNRSELAERLPRAKALIMPSLRESFGLVFIEALFAGIPIIYPRGTAVDGYFDGAPLP